MAVEGVGLPAHLGGRVEEPLRGGGGNDAFGDGAIAFDRAELGLEISLAVDALTRDPGIEKKRPPGDVDGNVGNERHCRFEPVFADIAPRAHDIGDDIDVQRRRRGGVVGHGFKPAKLVHPAGSNRLPHRPAFTCDKWGRVQRAATSPATRATRDSTLSVGFSVASVTAVSMPERLRSGASMVCLSTLAMRRAMT